MIKKIALQNSNGNIRLIMSNFREYYTFFFYQKVYKITNKIIIITNTESSKHQTTNTLLKHTDLEIDFSEIEIILSCRADT